MKLWKFVLLTALCVLLSACADIQEASPEPEPTLPGISFELFRDGYYQVVLPGWEEAAELDPESIYMVHQEGQFIAVNRYRNLPVLFADQFKSFIDEDPQSYLVQEGELAGKPFFEFTSRESDQVLRVQAVLDYCQGQTYALVVGGRDTLENADLFQQVLTSSSCQDPYSIPDLESGKIGLMVNPAMDDFWEGYYPALRLAKENGVQVIHSYLSWGEIEPVQGQRVWEWQDALMGYRFEEGFEVSLVVNLIHTSLRGPMPEDLVGREFDDPEFIARFTDFILEVLDRYPVSYLSIGNEVNDYFVGHREEIPAYRDFFLAVQDRIHREHPDVQVGMTFAYHDAERTNALDIIQELNLGDFLPVTLYLYSPLFTFDRDPTELEPTLERILDLAGEKRIAFVEIGWNTAASLSGNEVDQEAFVREAFRLLADYQDRIEFLAWFNLHDNIPENTYETAYSFLPEGAPQARDDKFMQDFVDFLSYLGLRTSDGGPKPGWVAFQEEASKYLYEVQE